ncbi:MAG: hypothetical protein MI919_27480, partial [Holophagales bacterium]|nr:hypothetical protein [Holophagales bacterium]
LWEEDLPKADGGEVERQIRYDRGGRIRSVSSLDAPGSSTRFAYDHRGRPVVEVRPDGSRAESLHYGERKSRHFECVATSGGVSNGPCTGTGLETVETQVLKDFFGRTRRVLIDGVGGHETTYTYDPADRPTSAARKAASGGTSQVRGWLRDGLGYLRQESVPERATTTFSSFDTRGNARQVTTAGRITNRTYDDLGRLRALSVAGLQVKSFDYFTSGSGNGQLREGVRRTHHLGIHTSTGNPGRFDVKSTFTYDSAGHRKSRTTIADFQEDGSPNVVRLGDFHQTWGYDALGNVTDLGYPTCLTGNYCTDDDLDVDYQYSQGYYLTGMDVAGSSTLGADLAYHESGLVHQVIHQGGGGTDIYGVAGGMSRIASMHLASGTPSALDLGAVTYDSAGNIRAIGSESFTYDRHSRLTDATVRGPGGLTSYSYSYDVFDNRTSPYTADPATNRIDAAGWGWDGFGNLTQVGNIEAHYDAVDKLISIDAPQGAGMQDHRQISLYDHDDLRILRWDKNLPGGTATWTLRDGLRVIREFDGTGPQKRTSADFLYAGARLVSSRRYPGTTFGGGNERHYH